MECTIGSDLAAQILPDTVSSVSQLRFLSAEEQCVFSRLQRRTYLFALLERAVGDDPSAQAGPDAAARIVQLRAGSDAECFMRIAGRAFDAVHAEAIHNAVLADYRRQYIGRST
ncbi:MAG TPA: hypothetical protein VMG60_02015 [Burkholderiaceae bacterium]|nr:hypothetical protein [Burkholderiaceae bacterium]